MTNDVRHIDAFEKMNVNKMLAFDDLIEFQARIFFFNHIERCLRGHVNSQMMFLLPQ